MLCDTQHDHQVVLNTVCSYKGWSAVAAAPALTFKFWGMSCDVSRTSWQHGHNQTSNTCDHLAAAHMSCILSWCEALPWASSGRVYSTVVCVASQ